MSNSLDKERNSNRIFSKEEIWSFKFYRDSLADSLKREKKSSLYTKAIASLITMSRGDEAGLNYLKKQEEKNSQKAQKLLNEHKATRGYQEAKIWKDQDRKIKKNKEIV